MAKKIIWILLILLLLGGCTKKENTSGVYTGITKNGYLMVGDYDLVVKTYGIEDCGHVWIENGKIKSSG